MIYSNQNSPSLSYLGTAEENKKIVKSADVLKNPYQ